MGYRRAANAELQRQFPFVTWTNSTGVVALGPNRGDSPTLGCGEQCEDFGTFHYEVVTPFPGHPVYTQHTRMPGLGWPNNSFFSFWGNNFHRASALVVNRTAPGGWTNRTWAHASTGIMHAFQPGLWGGWSFQMTGVNESLDALLLGYGGYQEARGGGFTKNNHFFVENIYEELDSPSEWFFDAEGHYNAENGVHNGTMLYYFPDPTAYPGSNPGEGLRHDEVVIPLLDSLVRVVGRPGKNQTARGITFSGLQFTETRSTYMEVYDVPSGGDWAVHRNAALYVESAEAFVLEDCLFDQVGGNGLMFNGHVTDSVVQRNEFAFCGDSAVVSVGNSRTIDGTEPTYPNKNLIQFNHIHHVGVFGKQTSCYFQALTANSSFVDNVCYDGPRAGLNYNDGAHDTMSPYTHIERPYVKLLFR